MPPDELHAWNLKRGALALRDFFLNIDFSHLTNNGFSKGIKLSSRLPGSDKFRHSEDKRLNRQDIAHLSIDRCPKNLKTRINSFQNTQVFFFFEFE